MAFAIAKRLEFTLGKDEPFTPVATTTESPEAYRLYLLGRYHWNRRDDSLDTARDYFQRAVDADPSYALAWAGLADAYLMLGGWSILSPESSYPRAAQAARRAIDPDSSLAEPHATLAYAKVTYERDWASARREFEQSISLDPEYATAHHWFGFYHLTVGDVTQGLAEMQKAQELDPLSPIVNVELGYFYYVARQYEKAEKTSRDALQLDPALGYVYSELARSFALRGFESKAREAVEKALELTGNSIFAWMFCGMVFAFLGDAQRAAQMLENLAVHGDKSYLSPQLPGMIHAVLGDNDRAFELFKASIEERSFIASWMRDPMIDKFSKDARFSALLNGIGLPA